MQTGNFPVDLILFGLVAVFLILRLRGILGRRVGFERPEQPARPTRPGAPGSPPGGGPVIEGRAEPPRTSFGIPDPATPLGQTLARIASADPHSEPQRFLESAVTAFRSIVTSFATGDRQTLRLLLTDSVLTTFSTVIDAREAAGERQVSEIRAVLSATIEDARLTGTIAAVSVKFISDQIAYTRRSNGAIAHGTEAITELVDLWTFERNLAVPTDGWRLAAARSA